MGAQADLRRGLGFVRPLGRVGAGVIEPADLPPPRTIDLPGRGRVTARVVEGPAPVLLLHGWTLTADVNFCHLMPRLPGGLVAMDHHGHGRGPRRAERFRIDDSADDHIALLDALGIDKVIVLGYSLGGPIGLDLARRHPDRVAGLVLQATALRFDSLVDKITKPLLRAIRPLTAFGMGRTVPLRFFNDTRDRSPETKMLWQWLRRELVQCHPRTLVDVMLAEYDFDFRPHAATLAGVPTVVVVTTKDSAVPPRDQRDMAHRLGADVVLLEDDHDAFLAAPKAYVAASLEAIARVTT
jgi:pimeloyl-ACP methyl ester carboxylesterase